MGGRSCLWPRLARVPAIASVSLWDGRGRASPSSLCWEALHKDSKGRHLHSPFLPPLASVPLGKGPGPRHPEHSHPQKQSGLWFLPRQGLQAPKTLLSFNLTVTLRARKHCHLPERTLRPPVTQKGPLCPNSRASTQHPTYAGLSGAPTSCDPPRQEGGPLSWRHLAAGVVGGDSRMTDPSSRHGVPGPPVSFSLHLLLSMPAAGRPHPEPRVYAGSGLGTDPCWGAQRPFHHTRPRGLLSIKAPPRLPEGEVEHATHIHPIRGEVPSSLLGM